MLAYAKQRQTATSQLTLYYVFKMYKDGNVAGGMSFQFPVSSTNLQSLKPIHTKTRYKLDFRFTLWIHITYYPWIYLRTLLCDKNGAIQTESLWMTGTNIANVPWKRYIYFIFRIYRSNNLKQQPDMRCVSIQLLRFCK